MDDIIIGLATAKLVSKRLGIPLDEHGMRMDVLANTLADLKAKGITPKYIYTIPTVQNPTCTILPSDRRMALLKLAQAHGVDLAAPAGPEDALPEGQSQALLPGVADAAAGTGEGAE